MCSDILDKKQWITLVVILSYFSRKYSIVLLENARRSPEKMSSWRQHEQNSIHFLSLMLLSQKRRITFATGTNTNTLHHSLAFKLPDNYFVSDREFPSSWLVSFRNHLSRSSCQDLCQVIILIWQRFYTPHLSWLGTSSMRTVASGKTISGKWSLVFCPVTRLGTNPATFWERRWPLVHQVI